MRAEKITDYFAEGLVFIVITLILPIVLPIATIGWLVKKIKRAGVIFNHTQKGEHDEKNTNLNTGPER